MVRVAGQMLFVWLNTTAAAHRCAVSADRGPATSTFTLKRSGKAGQHDARTRHRVGRAGGHNCGLCRVSVFGRAASFPHDRTIN